MFAALPLFRLLAAPSTCYDTSRTALSILESEVFSNSRTASSSVIFLGYAKARKERTTAKKAI